MHDFAAIRSQARRMNDQVAAKRRLGDTIRKSQYFQIVYQIVMPTIDLHFSCNLELFCPNLIENFDSYYRGADLLIWHFPTSPELAG